jgi:hypothetical protein
LVAAKVLILIGLIVWGDFAAVLIIAGWGGGIGMFILLIGNGLGGFGA